jgi:protease-4
MEHDPHESGRPDGPPPPPPSTGPPLSYGPPAAAPRRQVVEIVAKRGGFGRAVGFVIGLMVFLTVFLIGLGLGAAAMLASPSIEQAVLSQRYRDGSGDTIAVIPVTGTIDRGTAEFVRGAVDKILDMRSVKAVILRVDSPGGGVTASDQVWYQVNRLKKSNLPVIASYGSMAASGGYYVSCHADFIMAEETCVTGSIGVIAQIFTMEELMGKVGVEPVTLVATRSPRKDVANDMFRAWNDQDRTKVMTMLDAAYDTFLARVTAGRAASIRDGTTVEAIADGSVYTVSEAMELGLVDGVGYLDDAVREAERRAGLPADRPSVVILREPPSLFGGAPLLRAPRWSEGLPSADQLRSLVNDLAAPRLMYLTW